VAIRENGGKVHMPPRFKVLDEFNRLNEVGKTHYQNRK